VATASGFSWRTRTLEQIQEQRQDSKQQLLEAQDEQRQLKAVIPSSGPTYANFRALWRDGDWLPQISSLVPVGYGPKGVMLTLYGRALD
jgi:hypothetical protein